MTLPSLSKLLSPALTLPNATFHCSSKLNQNLHFLHLMPDNIFKKLPKFGKINNRQSTGGPCYMPEIGTKKLGMHMSQAIAEIRHFQKKFKIIMFKFREIAKKSILS
jgi:hypothetical protein